MDIYIYFTVIRNDFCKTDRIGRKWNKMRYEDTSLSYKIQLEKVIKKKKIYIIEKLKDKREE